MSDTVNLPLDRHLASGKYKVSVTAVDSFGKFSKRSINAVIDYTQPQ